MSKISKKCQFCINLDKREFFSMSWLLVYDFRMHVLSCSIVHRRSSLFSGFFPCFWGLRHRHLVSGLWPKRRSPNSLNFASFRAQLGSNSSSDAEPHIWCWLSMGFCIECSMHPNAPWIIYKQCSATCASRNSFHSKAWGSIIVIWWHLRTCTVEFRVFDFLQIVCLEPMCHQAAVTTVVKGLP